MVEEIHGAEDGCDGVKRPAELMAYIRIKQQFYGNKENQTEYNERYDALVSRYEDTERKRDAVVERIDQIDQFMIRRRKIERFIESVKGLPELYTEFDAGQWTALD